MNPLLQVRQHGQQIWLDNLSRTLLEEGHLARFVADDGVAGVTTNPAIFHKAISGGRYYEDDLATLKQQPLSAEARYEALVIPDVQRACNLLAPLHRDSGGSAGYVSLEVSPALAHDADQRKNVEEAVRTQFILDAIADAREVTVDNDDLSAQIMAQAQRNRMSPEQYAQQLQQGGNIAEFVAEVRRTKALAQLLEQTTITDASGNTVDLEALRPKTIQAPAADEAE